MMEMQLFLEFAVLEPCRNAGCFQVLTGQWAPCRAPTVQWVPLQGAHWSVGALQGAHWSVGALQGAHWSVGAFCKAPIGQLAPCTGTHWSVARNCRADHMLKLVYVRAAPDPGHKKLVRKLGRGWVCDS